VCGKEDALGVGFITKVENRYPAGLLAIQFQVFMVFLSLCRPVVGFAFEHAAAIGLKQ
jgi:hypothetical protein